jgi:hypothetical protein
MRHSIKSALSALIALSTSGLVAAQTMPSAPLPSGVTAGSNPIDQGVGMLQWGAKYGFYGISIFALIIAAYYALPLIIEWRKGKLQVGEAVGTIVGILVMIVIAMGVATYGFNQVGGGGAVNVAAF